MWHSCAYYIEDFRGCAKLIGLGSNDYFNGGELNCKMNGLECNELNSNEKRGRLNEGPVYDVLLCASFGAPGKENLPN